MVDVRESTTKGDTLKATKRGDRFTLTLDGLEALDVQCALRGRAIDYELQAKQAKDRGEMIEAHFAREVARDYWHMANIIEAETGKAK